MQHLGRDVVGEVEEGDEGLEEQRVERWAEGLLRQEEPCDGLLKGVGEVGQFVRRKEVWAEEDEEIGEGRKRPERWKVNGRWVDVRDKERAKQEQLAVPSGGGVLSHVAKEQLEECGRDV